MEIYSTSLTVLFVTKAGKQSKDYSCRGLKLSILLYTISVLYHQLDFTGNNLPPFYSYNSIGTIRLETDIIKYAKSVWTELQVEQLESEAPNWDEKRKKMIQVLQSDKKRFQQFEQNGTKLNLWSLIDREQVRYSILSHLFQVYPIYSSRLSRVQS